MIEPDGLFWSERLQSLLAVAIRNNLKLFGGSYIDRYIFTQFHNYVYRIFGFSSHFLRMFFYFNRERKNVFFVWFHSHTSSNPLRFFSFFRCIHTAFFTHYFLSQLFYAFSQALLTYGNYLCTYVSSYCFSGSYSDPSVE